jgi:hypothetical protein
VPVTSSKATNPDLASKNIDRTVVLDVPLRIVVGTVLDISTF